MKKPSAAQLAARKLFAARAKAGTLKKGKRKANPTKTAAKKATVTKVTIRKNPVRKNPTHSHVYLVEKSKDGKHWETQYVCANNAKAESQARMFSDENQSMYVRVNKEAVRK